MAKIMFAVPPIKDPRGYPTISQNRQYQVFKDPTFIYPIIPALCATMLAQSGHQAGWADCVADSFSDVDFARIITQLQPEYIIFEAPTPLIKRYWEIINGIKQNMPNVKIILCGEHVTALPDESRQNCQADHIIQGGDWHLKVYKLIMGSEWPKDKLLPHISRRLTSWWLYAYKNGNFKYLPGTYIMSAIDCWYRACKFCSWAEYHKDYMVRPVEDVLSEIEELVQAGFKEIFDDSGTLPVGEWLEKLCAGMIQNEYYKYTTFGCNMRFGAMKSEYFPLLKDAGFRMLIWGLESVNQKTLDRLNKGYSIDAIKRDLALASKAGLENHLTVMFGYPWEDYEDAKRTYDVARWLMRKGLAASAQATICIPYPITPLWKECKEQGLLLTEDWASYDMSRCVMKPGCSEVEIKRFQRGIYNMIYHPEFIWRTLKRIKSFSDLQYYLRVSKKVVNRFGEFVEIAQQEREA